MVQGYNDVLDRLKEVRERHMYSQEAISRILDMTQSHYSKAESFLYNIKCKGS